MHLGVEKVAKTVGVLGVEANPEATVEMVAVEGGFGNAQCPLSSLHPIRNVLWEQQKVRTPSKRCGHFEERKMTSRGQADSLQEMPS